MKKNILKKLSKTENIQKSKIGISWNFGNFNKGGIKLTEGENDDFFHEIQKFREIF